MAPFPITQPPVFIDQWQVASCTGFPHTVQTVYMVECPSNYSPSRPEKTETDIRFEKSRACMEELLEKEFTAVRKRKARDGQFPRQNRVEKPFRRFSTNASFR